MQPTDADVDNEEMEADDNEEAADDNEAAAAGELEHETDEDDWYNNLCYLLTEYFQLRDSSIHISILVSILTKIVYYWNVTTPIIITRLLDNGGQHMAAV